MLRKHGAKSSHQHTMPGFNSRLDTMQAAVLLVKLRYLDDWNELRRQKAALYNQLLSDVDGIQPIVVEEYGIPSFNYYTIRVTDSELDRNAILEHLRLSGIQAVVYYPLPLHLQEVFRDLGYSKGDFPESELLQGQVFSLPMYPELADEQIYEVVACISKFAKSRYRTVISR